ncbi:hypothetical protein OG599_33915 [Streptomyces sp. NBC_01335]|uniref:hypothetical protein n=1 Tax=Streptomyces sp. NBC_01335 TaxID=2903828 RepID=UPI002E16055B|nr:hypothetical protein OG599_33915 [Streptomyces sp. NBC_01335]
MPEGNAYFAEPGRLQAGSRQIDQISALAREIVHDFVSSVNLTRDWPGTDDSYAKEVLPQEQKERKAAVETGVALSDAIVGVADGTLANLGNILSTQSGVLDSIHRSSGSGSHGGKH